MKKALSQPTAGRLSPGGQIVALPGPAVCVLPMHNSASLLHEQWTDQGSRILRFQLVLLLFDDQLSGHGRTRPDAAARGHLSALPRADALADRHPLRHPGQVIPAYPGPGQEGPQEVQDWQEEKQHDGQHDKQYQQHDKQYQQQHEQHVIMQLGRYKQSSVAGRLGLPALAPEARLESVDAMAAAVVAAGPLTGAALSLVLDAILPSPRTPRTPTRLGDVGATNSPV